MAEEGKTYGYLTVIKEVDKRNGRRMMLVQCGCDSKTQKVVQLGCLRSGNTKSCGCHQKNSVKSANTKHGLSKTPLYQKWKAMVRRCTNPKADRYSDYGGRGIGVSERWRSFENFLSDMGASYSPGLTLDRKDNDKGYSLDNCRWATKMEQERNKRTNFNVTHNNKTQCLTAWCEELNLKYGSVQSRIKKGKTPTQALGLEATTKTTEENHV